MWPLRTNERWGNQADEAAPRGIPALDELQTAQVQTATFALG